MILISHKAPKTCDLNLDSSVVKNAAFRFRVVLPSCKPGSHQDEITGISPRKSFVFQNSLTRSEGGRKRALLANEAAFMCWFFFTTYESCASQSNLKMRQIFTKAVPPQRALFTVCVLTAGRTQLLFRPLNRGCVSRPNSLVFP